MDGFWESGLSGEEIYRNFTEASGGGELAAAAEIVRGVQAEHEEEAATVRALAVRMESAWQGDAAGAAQRGAVPLAAEHEWGAPRFFTAQDLTSRQVGSFGDARHGVVPVPPAPDKPRGWAIITSPTALPTYERQLAEHNAAAQHNVDVMTGYEDASSFNGDNLPTSYGSITPDSAGIAVQPPDKGPDGGGRVDGPSGPRADDGGRPAGGSEWKPTGGSSGGPDPAASSGRPGGESPQETTPGGYVPPKPSPGPGPGVPGAGVPSGPGGGGGFVGVPPIGILPGGPGSGTGYGTRGPGGGAGGSDGGSGGRGGVPGGGRPGAGPGGGEAGHGQRGGSSGVGPPAGGAAAGARGGAGGLPMGMGAGRGRGGEDEERERPSWLIEPGDPEDTFGTDERTAPPVIGDQDEDKD